MLTRLRLTNYQNVIEWDEELSPGINCFVGPSGSGKTARAIRAPFQMIFNRPAGVARLYDPRKVNNKLWAPGPTSITVWTSEGDEITKVRGSSSYWVWADGVWKEVKGNSENYYTINNGQPITGFGQGVVPGIISKALNITPMSFQLQHTRRVEDERFSQCNPLYLLSLSPSEIASALNEIAGLDDIDASIAHISDRLNSEKSTVKTQKALKEKHEVELLKYTELDALSKAVAETEILERKIKEKTIWISELNKASDDLSQKEKRFARFKNLSLLRVAQTNLEKLTKEKAEHQQKANDLRALSTEIKQAEARSNKYKKLHDLRAAIESLFKKVEDLKATKARLLSLKAALLEIIEAERNLATTEAALKKIKTKWEKIRPQTCPTCGTDMGGRKW